MEKLQNRETHMDSSPSTLECLLIFIIKIRPVELH